MEQNKKSFLNDLIDNYRKTHPKSEKFFYKASRHLIKGGSHNLRLFSPYPFYDIWSKGSKISDLDGHTYVDFWQGHFGNILGHNPDIVLDALKQHFEEGQGLETGFPEKYQIKLANIILSRINADKIRFTTSGTLASMYATMLAKAYTQKEYVLKIGGGWHGAQPYALKGITQYKNG